jgi:hypothetical protein
LPDTVDIGVTVTLTLHELAQAAHVGIQRHLRALRRGAHEPYGSPRDPWEACIGGAAGEMALAKHRNVFWVDDPKLDYDGDVGSLQVRWTKYPNGHLLLYNRNPDDAYYVLVTGEPPVLCLRGFILAEEGKRDEYLADERLRSDGYMVPQSALTPIELLP